MKRKRKEDFWNNREELFLGIEVNDTYSSKKLIKILEPYIGICKVKEKIYGNVEINYAKSKQEKLLEICEEIKKEYGFLPSLSSKEMRKKYPGLSNKISKYMGGIVNVRKILESN